MGKLLCEKNLRDVWCRNESVRAEIGQILHTHTQTDASILVVPTTVDTAANVEKHTLPKIDVLKDPVYIAL